MIKNKYCITNLWCSGILNKEKGFILSPKQICDLLNQQNQRWEMLKKLLLEDMEHNSREYDESLCLAFQHYSATENWVLDRMEELEKENLNEKKNTNSPI